MYAPFFGLSKEPFSIAPDPRFLFMSEQHREALAHLLYGLSGGGGFVLLTGEIGAGKTTVCRCFLEQLPAQCTVAYIFNPKLTVAELLQTVCVEFGIAPPEPAGSVKAHVDALNAFLLAAHAQGRQAVLVIDEAQSLSADVLEQLRLLTNLETAERKLLQIILVGQPELRDMLARPELEQLAQRVIARCHLAALSRHETVQYIRHRLAVAGPSAPLPFSSAALARIHALSGGVPRRINLLADRALLGAYAQGQARVERPTVEQAAREVFAPAGSGLLTRPAWAALAAVVGLAAAGAVVWAGWRATVPVGLSATSGAASSAAAGRAASSTLPVPAAGAEPDAAAGPRPRAAASGRPLSGSDRPAAEHGESAVAPPAAGSGGPVAVSEVQSWDDPQALLAAAAAEPAIAWRELALHWGLAIGEGEPCATAARGGLACFRSPAGGLAGLRQVQRPASLVLRSASGPVRFAVLVALDARQATLQAGASRFTLALPALLEIWRGEFNTFWRPPPGWRETAAGAGGAASPAWLDEQLARAGQPPGRPQAERVRAFQLAQGLPLDGLAGPLTLMQLGRFGGVDEPHLPLRP